MILYFMTVLHQKYSYIFHRNIARRNMRWFCRFDLPNIQKKKKEIEAVNIGFFKALNVKLLNFLN